MCSKQGKPAFYFIILNKVVNIKIQKNICQKDYNWNPATCSGENDKYLTSIIDHSVITCDEIIEETKSILTNFNEKKMACKTKHFCLTCLFLNYYGIIDSC